MIGLDKSDNAYFLEGKKGPYIKDAYRSEKYKEYKRLWMAKKTGGTKIKPYVGVSVRSNKTRSVNMLLTGQLIDGLEYHSSDKTSLTMSYKKKDENKIKGNEDLGRDIRTLNEVNIKKVKKQIVKYFDANIRKHIKKNITIGIGKV